MHLSIYFYKCFTIASILILQGCAGILFTDEKLTKKYQHIASSQDIQVYYNLGTDKLPAAVRNISNSFMTNLNVALECYKKDVKITDIQVLSNLKTYYFKELVFNVDVNSCDSVSIKYVYYPVHDAGFAFEDRNNLNFIANTIPSTSIEGAIVIK